MEGAMPRLVYLAGVGTALVALALAVTDAALGPRPGITEANVRRLKPGMTKEQVAAIHGVPAESLEDWVLWGQGLRWSAHGPEGKAHLIFMAFGRDFGRLYSASFEPTSRVSPLDRLRGWLGW